VADTGRLQQFTIHLAVVKTMGLKLGHTGSLPEQASCLTPRFRMLSTIKESCLQRMILFGEASLRKAVHEFVAHYHQERNHQGLGNRLISPQPSDFGNTRTIKQRQRLGGMLNYYYRAAA
jgi:hypothetical protein